MWSSKQGIYVWYDYSTSRLHFKDGSFWYMGCISSGTEQDAGAMYPTLMQDSNGNQITVTYLPGAGPYASNGAGANPPNSSARISQIMDSRSGALYNGHYSTGYSFSFNSDQINHLTGIANDFGTSENYSFTFVTGSLNAPFPGATACGSTNSNCGSVGFLKSLTRTGVNLTTVFSYDANLSTGYGELTQVTFPYNGYIGWTYQTSMNYAGNRYLREVGNPSGASRVLLKDTTAPLANYYFHWDQNGNSSQFLHASFAVQDASGSAGKVWTFNQSTGTPWMMGLAATMESRTNWSTGPGPHYDALTWSQDTGGNPYISQQDTYLDKGTGNERHSYTTTSAGFARLRQRDFEPGLRLPGSGHQHSGAVAHDDDDVSARQ